MKFEATRWGLVLRRWPTIQLRHRCPETGRLEPKIPRRKVKSEISAAIFHSFIFLFSFTWDFNVNLIWTVKWNKSSWVFKHVLKLWIQKVADDKKTLDYLNYTISFIFQPIHCILIIWLEFNSFIHKQNIDTPNWFWCSFF